MADSARLCGLEHRTRYYYTLRDDTLWTAGFENPTTRMDYVQAEPRLAFPFAYGDTLRGVFEGRANTATARPLAAGGHPHRGRCHGHADAALRHGAGGVARAHLAPVHPPAGRAGGQHRHLPAHGCLQLVRRGSPLPRVREPQHHPAARRAGHGAVRHLVLLPARRATEAVAGRCGRLPGRCRIEAPPSGGS